MNPKYIPYNILNLVNQALEGEEDLDEVLEKAREKSQRRAANKLLRESEGQSSRNSPAVEETRGRKKKGRPPKNPQPEVDYVLKDVEGYAFENYGLEEGKSAVVVVRPDTYIGAFALGADGVQKYLDMVFGSSPA